jgi:hypothetical protein
MIAKKDKRSLEEFHAQEKLDQDIKSFRQQNSVREGHLDNLMDHLQAKFSDINTALQFDVNRIDRKLVSITFKGETEAACLGQRTNVALCFKSKAGDKCDEYIKALEMLWRCGSLEETINCDDFYSAAVCWLNVGGSWVGYSVSSSRVGGRSSRWMHQHEVLPS